MMKVTVIVGCSDDAWEFFKDASGQMEGQMARNMEHLTQVKSALCAALVQIDGQLSSVFQKGQAVPNVGLPTCEINNNVPPT